MKVTHIIDSGGYYGAEVMLVHLCQAQQQTGMDVEVISIGTPGNYKKPLEEKLEEHGIRYIPWRMRALPDLRESFRILKHCKQGGSDVIHSHGYKGNILLGLIPRRLRKIPVITTVHGYTRQSRFSKMTIYQWLDRLCLPRLDAVVIVSEGMRHQIPEKKLGSKLHVVANGIPDQTDPAVGESGKQIIFKDDFFNIISIGRLSREKNFSLLIKIMPALIKINKKSRLYIFGEGSERNTLERLISDLKISDHVYLPGYTTRSEYYYRSANLFVNCSLTEGMPITILEAMRAGCPILVSNIPANISLLKGSPIKNNFFENSEKELLKAVISMQESNRDEAVEFFKENFSSSKTEKAYRNIYFSIS